MKPAPYRPQGHLLALEATKHGRHGEGLAQEPLNLAKRNTAVLSSGERVSLYAENRDDVLQILIALEHNCHAKRDIVVLLADNFRRERPGGRGERINRRIDTELRN